jgi:hypothetical protein
MWWPGTELNRRRQPFQGRLPNCRSGSESTHDADAPRLTPISVWASVGSFGLNSVRGCSRMVRGTECRCGEARFPLRDIDVFQLEYMSQQTKTPA